MVMGLNSEELQTSEKTKDYFYVRDTKQPSVQKNFTLSQISFFS